jgi:hypothetical protein
LVSLIAMKLAWAIGVGCAMAVARVALAIAAPSHSAALGCKPQTGKRIVTRRDFRFTLLVGNAENMYMPYQVRANHLKHGEEMLRGSMTPVAMLTGGIRVEGSLHKLIAERSTLLVDRQRRMIPACSPSRHDATKPSVPKCAERLLAARAANHGSCSCAGWG